MTSVSAIQLASGPNIEANLLQVENLMGKAAENGSKLIVLPENFALMGNTEREKLRQSERQGDGRTQQFLSAQASQLGVWVVGGTVPLQCPDRDKVYAATLVYDDCGQQVARYDKMHLFDVRLMQTGEQFNESATIEPGDAIVVIDTPFGKLGLAVCYDLRFPELFRAMLDRGAEMVALPAAFTAQTGEAHWEILIRARAIENLIYVIAADQGGYHVNGRKTYGRSMIVDPWGNILDCLQQGPGIASADVDLSSLRAMRQRFPALDHRRLSA